MPFTDIPPSYDASISRETWTILAPYIPSADLCACCLVSRKWHSIFVPFLWGDPASHFGIANDAVYVALTRFKRTLRKARPSVRALTHTLHLPPALSEIYGGPHPTWLRDVLEYLPYLQSLIVVKLPFFDHHSLVALGSTNGSRRLSSEDQANLPTFGLKLLLASSEPNTTSTGLSIAIPRFPNLVYLDLSYTKPARDASVLLALSSLHDLQVLKLRGVGLRDGEAEVLANAIGIRVRLLDVRDNFLTDMAVRSLMQACFYPPDRDQDAARLNSRRVEDWPVGMAPGPDFFSLDTLRSEDLDHELLKQLTNPLTGRLAFEDIPHRGLTHLYIADNQLSVEGLSSLLRSERLHVLDGGTVDTIKTIARTQSLTSPTGHLDEVKFPGAEKLIPILAQSACKNLTYLRVDHALITARLDSVKEVPQPKGAAVELAGTAPLAAELPSESRLVVEAPASAHYAVELPSSGDPIFEMDATPPEPRYELVGDVIHFALSPPVGDKPEPETPAEEAVAPIRGEGAYAPEVVTNGNGHITEQEDDNVVFHASGPGISAKVSDGSSPNRATRSMMSSISPVTPAVKKPFPSLTDELARSAAPVGQVALPTSAPVVQQPAVSQIAVPLPAMASTQRRARIDSLLQQRPQPLCSIQTNNSMEKTKLSASAASMLTSLHPSLLPNVRCLIVTNLPISTPSTSTILPRLKSFISACAAESAMSRLLAKTDYSLPPGRARHNAEQEAAKRLFALHTIVLEMASPSQPTERPTNNPGSGRAWEHSRQRLSMSKSSTGDRDSENLWSAAENDFSFFGEEGEEKDECGIYQHDPEKYFPTTHLDDKIFVGDDDGLSEGRVSPHGSFQSATLSPIHAMGYGGGGGGGMGRSQTILQSPRNLPLGRNRRSSNEAQRNQPEARGSLVAEMAGSVPTMRLAPTSNPIQTQDEVLQEEPMLDTIAELAKWRKERKSVFEEEMAKYQRGRSGSLSHANGVVVEPDVDLPFVEGHWKGEIKVVRNAVPKGRTGTVDMYGNYFEKGYLYP